MYQTTVVVGTQWGDEGKGKISNYLSETADMVVRYQGGDNAGHTIVFGGNTYKLHLIPSGVFFKQVTNVLANGMVINPFSFLEEVSYIKQAGYPANNIVVSDRAHVILPYHQLQDAANEQKRGTEKIGTTNKGIGPAYTDKVSREGIRMADFVGPNMRTILSKKLDSKNKELLACNMSPLDFEEVYQTCKSAADQIRPYVTDTITLVNEAIDKGKKVIFEGAQGALLDVDFGSYPYVTSSNTSGGGVCIGSGVGPKKITNILGIVKAYSTRVGSGAFPTEFEDAVAKQIRQVGNEYGTTTKRPRRIGWFDAVLLKYSSMINGLTGLSIMLLDVLSGVETLQVCTGYMLNGKEVHTVPARIEDFDLVEPIYVSLPGWTEDITQVTTFNALPKNAQNYLRFIEKAVGVSIEYFSVGPDKDQTIKIS